MPKGVHLDLPGLWGCVLYTGRLLASKPLALFYPGVCKIRCILVVDEQLSDSLPCDIGKLPSAEQS